MEQEIRIAPEGKLQKTFFVGANEGNARGELALPIMASNIIDIATTHANQLHIGNPDMEDSHGGWVLSRLTIEMDRWPKVNETYTLTTWIESYNRHFSSRAFRVDDAEGRAIGYARSIWMIIDTVSHRNLGLSHLPISAALIDGTEAPLEKQARHRPILLPEVAEGEASVLCAAKQPVKYTFKYCDIDFYRHVNTVRYIVLLLNQFTLQQLDERPVRRLELSFMREAVYGMTVDILEAKSENPLLRTFTLCEEGKHREPLLFARLHLDSRLIPYAPQA